jgi:hypothetical protein
MNSEERDVINGIFQRLLLHVDELRHRVGGVGLGADLVGDEALRVGIAGGRVRPTATEGVRLHEQRRTRRHQRHIPATGAGRGPGLLELLVEALDRLLLHVDELRHRVGGVGLGADEYGSMNSEERDVINGIFQRLEQAAQQPRDADAEPARAAG